MRILNLALICLALAGSTVGHAGEALVTRVRGSKMTIDMGAEAGLMVGMAVTIVRPPGESVVHPITGENLGAPEIEIGRGTISKTSGRVASVQIEGNALLTVRPGDVARFVTPEEEMIMDQERSIASTERNQEEHQEFRKGLSSLTSSLKSLQGRIGSLESLMKRVERVEDGFRVQLQGIHKDMNEMKDDIRNLKDQVALYGPVPVEGMVEGPEGGTPSLTEEDVEQIVRKVVDDLQPAAVQAGVAPESLPPLPKEEDISLGLESEEEEAPFYKQSWFIFGLIGVIGIGAVTAFLAMRMMASSEEDEEEDEDEELEEDEEEMEIEVEEAEEDDIVVEETS